MILALLSGAFCSLGKESSFNKAIWQAGPNPTGHASTRGLVGSFFCEPWDPDSPQ